MFETRVQAAPFDLAAEHARLAALAPDVGAIEAPVAFTTDDRGRMFVLDADGELFRIDAA